MFKPDNGPPHLLASAPPHPRAAARALVQGRLTFARPVSISAQTHALNAPMNTTSNNGGTGTWMDRTNRI